MEYTLNQKATLAAAFLFDMGWYILSSSRKKLNTKISNKAEVVAVSDYLPYNIWIYLFMGAQGYDIGQKLLFQDNQSATNMRGNKKKP